MLFSRIHTSHERIKRWVGEVHEKAMNEQYLFCSKPSVMSNAVELILCGLSVLAFLLFSFFFARETAYCVPTYHVDGAFQTASGLFRLQAGEMPGRDFYPYLGILPVFVLYPVFLLAGGNVTASVFAAHFIVLLCCMSSFGIIHFFLSRKRNLLYSLSCGSVLTIIFYYVYANVPSVHSFLNTQAVLVPGNSLRPIRQFAPYLCILIAYLLYRKIDAVPAFILCFGALWIGLFSLWSNDYALGTVFFTLSGSSIWLLTSERPKRGRLCFCLIVLCLAGIVVFYELATQGNAKSLFLYNFRDVATDQYWYFEPLNEEFRVYSLSSFWNMLVFSASDLILPFIAVLILAVDIVLTKSFEKICLLLVGCLLFLGGLTASVGGHIADYFRFFFFWGLGVVIFYVFSLSSYLKYERARKFASLAIIFLVTSWGCAAMMIDCHKRANELKNSNDYFYEASLGGYLPASWKPFLVFLDENRNKSFLEEYWGIASAYLHRNSDWKVDSVIHAFNKTREDSSHKILDKDFIITSSSAMDWTIWSISQNYWFYKEVFHNYDFCFSVSDTVFVWKKREMPRVFQDAENCHLIDSKSFQIDAPGLYEIHLEYDYTPRFHSLLVLDSPLDLPHFVSFPPYQKSFDFLVSCYETKVFSLQNFCTPAHFSVKAVEARKVRDDIESIYDLWRFFYLTDDKWERGYYRESGGFMVRNTKENSRRYAVGAFVRSPDESLRQITQVWEFPDYLSVFTKGDSFVASVFPHQLEVIQDSDTDEYWNAFYFSDETWDRGYYRGSGGFLVKKTKENTERYVVGAFVRLPDGTLRQITHVWDFTLYLYIFTTGGSFVAPVFPHQLEVVQNQENDADEDWSAFYLTDENWEKGYFRNSGGFFVKSTKENAGRYVIGAFVQLPDGSRRQITQIWGSAQYLNVLTEGDSFVAPVFPHQLDVIPKDVQENKGISEQ